MSIRKIISQLCLALVLGMSLLPSFTVAKVSLEAFGVDAVAGYAALITTNASLPNTPVEFLVTKPDGSQLYLQATTNAQGIARLDLYGYHTQKAGKYSVAVRSSTTTGFSSANVFQVYPGDISASKSALRISDSSVPADGNSAVYVGVELRDAFNNPIASRNVNLISSRATDTIKYASKRVGTDANGKVDFVVRSSEPGVSTLSAFDSISGTVLSARAKVIFTDVLPGAKSKVSQNLSASFIGQASAASGDIVGKVTRLEIFDYPQQVDSNSAQELSVRALDNNDMVVESYTGRIIFTTTDQAEVDLPQSYTFTPADLGSATLDFKLLTEGTQRITVADANDASIQGTADIIVIEPRASGDLVLTTPTSGKYTTHSLEISGNGPKLKDIDIYDGTKKLGTVPSTSDGKFTYTANNLASGAHAFTAKLASQSLVSNTVNVTIDDSGPQLISVTVDPTDPFSIGTPFTLIVKSEPNLQSVKAVFNKQSYTLTENLDEAGTYTIPMVAPSPEGGYPVDVILENATGGKTEEKAAYTVQVVSACVYGVRVIPRDGEVILNWNPFENAKDYEVSYGVERGKAYDKFKTDGENEVTVTDLENSRTYFFQIAALDASGNVMTKVSGCDDIVVTPTDLPPVVGLTVVPEDAQVQLDWTDYEGAAKYKVEFGVQSGLYSEHFTTKDEKSASPVWGLINGTKYYFRVTALDANGDTLSSPSAEVSAVPVGKCKPVEVKNLSGIDAKKDGHVVLTWDADPSAFGYAIYSGKSAEKLERVDGTKNNTWEKDFDEGTYYFAVHTVCADIGEDNAVQMIKVEAGPEVLIIVFGSLVFVWGVQRVRRRARA